MNRIRNELAEAAARLHSNRRVWHEAQDEYWERVGDIRSRCTHPAVAIQAAQYQCEYVCRDCGHTATEPFGTPAQ